MPLPGKKIERIVEEIAYYSCEKCGKKYRTYDAAETCEEIDSEASCEHHIVYTIKDWNSAPLLVASCLFCRLRRQIFLSFEDAEAIFKSYEARGYRVRESHDRHDSDRSWDIERMKKEYIADENDI